MIEIHVVRAWFLEGDQKHWIMREWPVERHDRDTIVDVRTREMLTSDEEVLCCFDSERNGGSDHLQAAFIFRPGDRVICVLARTWDRVQIGGITNKTDKHHLGVSGVLEDHELKPLGERTGPDASQAGDDRRPEEASGEGRTKQSTPGRIRQKERQKNERRD